MLAVVTDIAIAWYVCVFVHLYVSVTLTHPDQVVRWHLAGALVWLKVTLY